MDANRQTVLSSARSYAYDDYLAALFSPYEMREDLFCLSAYYGELARISLTVKEDILAQIRFQWWRDTLERGVSTGYPIADKLLKLHVKKKIPVETLLSLLEQRARELDPQFLSTTETIQASLKTMEIPHFKARAILLGCPLDTKLEDLLAEACPILGAVRLCLRLPSILARRATLARQEQFHPISEEGVEQNIQRLSSAPFIETLVPKIKSDYLDLRNDLRALEDNYRILFLPLALVPSYLKVLQEGSAQNKKTPLPLVRLLSLFLSAKLGWF